MLEFIFLLKTLHDIFVTVFCIILCFTLFVTLSSLLNFASTGQFVCINAFLKFSNFLTNNIKELLS